MSSSFLKWQTPPQVSWVGVLSPSQAPVAPFQYQMLWWSTLLAFLALMPIVNTFSQIFLPLAFVVVTKLIPPAAWTPLGRITLFGVLITTIILTGGGLTKEVGTAILMVTMIVKFAEMKRIRDAHMMVLFNTIAPFVAFLQDQTPLILMLGLTSLFVTMTLGKSLTELNPPGADHPMRQALKSMMLQSTMLLPLVVVAYMIAPRLDNPLWGGYGQMRSRTGFTEQMDVARWTELFNDLSTAFRVRFDGPVPPQKDLYFRGATLWTFDGEVWRKDPFVAEAVIKVRQSRTPSPDSKIVKYAVTYEPAIHNSFFVLDYPINLSPTMLRATDDQVYSLKRIDRVNTVSWVSAMSVDFAPLSDAERNSALQLPEGRNPRTIALAKNWRARFDTDAEYARFVMNHFRTEGYNYSFSPPPVGREAVDDFFLNTKQGFCQHYSSAFVVLMRAAGVPARVVTGYWGGENSDLGDYLRVRQADAHAWAEVWIDGRWQRYDPTAILGSSRVRDEMRWNVLNSSYEMADWMKDIWNRWFLYYDDTEQKRVMDRAKEKVSQAVDLKVSPGFYAGVFALLGVLWVSFLWRRRLKTMDDVLIRIHDWFEDSRYPPTPGWSWRQRFDRLTDQWSKDRKDRAWFVLLQLEKTLFDPKSAKNIKACQKWLSELKKIKRQKNTV